MQVDADLGRGLLCCLLAGIQQNESARQRFFSSLVLICLTSTTDHESLRKLADYDEAKISDLVFQTTKLLRENLQPGKEEKLRAARHQLALLSSVWELAARTILYSRERLLDKTQTFQQNRQIYLSFLHIDSAAACVKIDEEFAKVIAGCKMFTPQAPTQQAPTPQIPSIKHFQQLVDPRYLPIRTYEDLPWEVQKDFDYEGALQFTAFVSKYQHDHGRAQQGDHESLFVLFQSLHSSDKYGKTTSGANLRSRRNILREEVRAEN